MLAYFKCLRPSWSMMEFFHCHEIALLDMMAGIGYETQIERQVVDAGYLHRQQLLCLEEVMEVGLGGNRGRCRSRQDLPD